MIFVVPRELKTCVEAVEFDDGNLPEPRRIGENASELQPIAAELSIVKTSVFKMPLKSDFCSVF